MQTEEVNNCSELKRDLAEVKTLAEEFLGVYEEGDENKDMMPALELITILEQKLENLQAKLENLVPLKEYRVEEQYFSQLDNLKSINQLESLSTGELGIIGIDGKEYPVPTLAEIKSRILRRAEVFKRKTSQGFSRMMLVPFALPLAKTIDNQTEQITKHTKAAYFKGSDGRADNRILLDQLGLGGADEFGVLKYFPTQFGVLGHNGKTKSELLDSGKTAGWQIAFIEGDESMPGKNSGKANHERISFDKGGKPVINLLLLNTKPEYANECGFTPELLLSLANDEFSEVIRSEGNLRTQGNYDCLGAIMAGRLKSVVPAMGWNSDGGRLILIGIKPDDISVETRSLTSVIF